ncbi:MAG: protein kinase [Myxococcales bacterium]|nr:protein kinase [Myxococcales bacterium]
MPRARLLGGRYRLGEELGRGGMAVVYRALDVGSQTEVALKNLQPQARHKTPRQSVSMFEREYHTLAQLSHPRIIDVYDYGVDQAGPFYTMELLDGGDLQGLSPLSPLRVCELMLEVCSSLALLHSRRLLHRDVSPRNVRCTRDGHAKLIDFGALMPMGPATEVVGTPAFVAPEVLHRAALDARSDLFSFGGTLYYALTRKLPFAAKDFSQLRHAWNHELVPPSRHAPGIPPALDALCASLLRIDPTQRPRSAFEVMPRLEAIANTHDRESIEVSRAYLDTPVLVGRASELRSVRHHLRRALHGVGNTILFQGETGLGRSRILDACALQAKTFGTVVLRSGATVGPERQFGVVQDLFEQLLQQIPAVARSTARQAGICEQLIVQKQGATAGGSIRSLADPPEGRGRLQMDLCAWLARICDTHAVAITIDDLERIDEASLSLLAELAMDAPRQRLLLLTTSDPNATQRAPGAYHMLARHGQAATLSPLTPAESAALVASVFGDVANVAFVADRIHSVALGSPQQTMALAQHLVDNGVIHYQDARWTLPAKLDANDLPTTAMDAFVRRIEGLPPLARTLAEALALLGQDVLSRDDFRNLAPKASASQLEGALLALLQADLVQGDGLFYSLRHRTLAGTLRALMSAADARATHTSLAEFRRQQKGKDLGFLVAHHLNEAGRSEDALDVLSTCALVFDDQVDMALELDFDRVAATGEGALVQLLASDRSKRAEHDLRFGLCSAAILAQDEGVFYRNAPAWLAQLERDAGLLDYHALPASLDPHERLQRALTRTITRFEKTPERERVYPVDEAIKMLCFYVIPAVTTGSRVADTDLLSSLPALLEPLAPLSPAVHAMWQDCLGIQEALCLGRTLAAHRRLVSTHEALEAIEGDQVAYLESIRNGLAHLIGMLEARLARESAHEWAKRVADDRLYAVNAMQSRAVARLMQGDGPGANEFRKQAELLALRSNVRHVLVPRWHADLEAGILASDLGWVHRAMEGLSALAKRSPRWTPAANVATGYFQLFKGKEDQAEAPFQEALELCRPGKPGRLSSEDTWAMAVAGLVSVRRAQGRLPEAIDLAREALERCHAEDIDVSRLAIARALALAEARAGDIEHAAARVERLIEWTEAHDIRGLHLVASFHVRAQIAVWARDEEAARRYALLALHGRGESSNPTATPELVRLVDEARANGLEITLGLSNFEASVFGAGTATLTADACAYAKKLATCHNPEARARQALHLLCNITHAAGGHLYLVGRDGELSLVASQEQAPPTNADRAFARFFFAEHIGDELPNASPPREEQATRMLTVPGAATYVDERGTEHRVMVLSCKLRSELMFVGLFTTASPCEDPTGERIASQCSAVASALVRSGDARPMAEAGHVTRTDRGTRPS